MNTFFCPHSFSKSYQKGNVLDTFWDGIQVQVAIAIRGLGILFDYAQT